LLALAATMPAVAHAVAPVDINQASEAQLDGINGLGPATTRRILAERERRPFTDWADVIARVKGIGPALAAKLSDGGLSVEGQRYRAPAAPVPDRAGGSPSPAD